MSFDESIFSAGFNQKTVNGDLFVKENHGIPPRDQHGKVPKDSRRISTKAGLDPLTCGAGRPHLEATRSLWAPPVILFVMSVLYHLLGCISAVISSWFDPRAKDGCPGLHIPAYTSRRKPNSLPCSDPES